MGVMEFETRKLRRKPLSDCTNIPTTTTAAAIKPPHNSSSKTSSTGSNANHAQYPSLRPPQLNTPEDADVATIKNRRLLQGSDKRKEVAETVPFSGSLARRIRIIGEKLVKVHRDVALSTANNKQNSIIRPQPSTPPRPNASAICVDSSKNVGSVILCSRRLARDKTRDEGQKAAETGPFTCPPEGRIRSITKGNRLVEEHGNVSLPNSCIDDRPQSKKRRRFSSPNLPSLSQDYIDKQRAYFAEIDAFELPEEVVSENELE